MGLDGGNLAERAHHPVAEVVVADRLAAQPGVFGVSDLRVDGGAEEGEVHRLLGVVDEGVVGSEERPADEEDQEDCLCDDDGAPLARDEVSEVVEIEIGDVNGQRNHEQHGGRWRWVARWGCGRVRAARRGMRRGECRGVC